jgi:hypothetical protein
VKQENESLVVTVSINTQYSPVPVQCLRYRLHMQDIVNQIGEQYRLFGMWIARERPCSHCTTSPARRASNTASPSECTEGTAHAAEKAAPAWAQLIEKSKRVMQPRQGRAEAGEAAREDCQYRP